MSRSLSRLVLRIALGACAPLSALPAQPAATARVAGRDSARIAGWYELAPGRKVLVVWGPTGGYRLLDFDSAKFHRLDASAGGYSVAGSGAWARARVRFERDAAGAAVGFTLSPDSAPVVRAKAAAEYPFDLEEVRFRNGDTELAGLLMVPRVRKLVGRTGTSLREVPLRLPAAVFIHGSGDSDRDNVWAFTLAQHVARAGFLTLLPDKRGSGASRGDWRRAGLDGLGDDALSAVALLRNDARVDAARVGLIGLSQGGVVAPLAAKRASDIAFVVSVSTAPMPLFDQMRHEMVQDLKRAPLPDAGVSLAMGVGEKLISHSRLNADSSWSDYVAARAALAASPFAAAAAGFPAERGDWRWEWWRAVGFVDPLPAWAELNRPAYAIFGEDDERDNVPVRESVQRLGVALRPELNSQNAVRVYPGLGHTLVDSAEGWVSRKVLADLQAWMLQTVGGLDPKATGSTTGPASGARH